MMLVDWCGSDGNCEKFELQEYIVKASQGETYVVIDQVGASHGWRMAERSMFDKMSQGANTKRNICIRKIYEQRFVGYSST